MSLSILNIQAVGREMRRWVIVIRVREYRCLLGHLHFLVVGDLVSDASDDGLAVQRGVETEQLLLLGDAETDGQVDGLREDQGGERGVDDGAGAAEGLGGELVLLVRLADGVEHTRVVGGDGTDGHLRVGVVREVQLEVLGRGEEAGQDAAEQTASGVHAEGIQGVVIAGIVLDLGSEVAPWAGQETDEEGAGLVDPSTCGGDGDETSDGTGEHSEHRGLLLDRPLGEHPGEGGHGGS